MMGVARSILRVAATLLVVAGAASALPGPAAPSAPLLGDPTPDAPNAIHAVYATRVLDSLDGFEIQVDLRVHEMELAPAGSHSAAELRAAPAPVREAFEAAVRDAILGEAQRVLPDAEWSLQRFAVDYGSENGDANPYDPPIAIHANLGASFTPAFFGLPPTINTPPRLLARAFLYSGGVYAVSKDLQVPPGYDVRHIVNVPEFLELRGGPQDAVPRLEFHKDNFQGSGPGTVRVSFSVQLRPDGVPANVAAGPLVNAAFLVDDATPLWKQTIPFTKGDYVARLNLEIEVHSLSSSVFSQYPLPAQMSLPQISADLLRIAINENIVSRNDVEVFFEDLIRSSLEEGFGSDVQLQLDRSSFHQSLALPVGGTDGTTVAPLLIHAYAVLPFESNKMLVSSSLGRLFGMTLGMKGQFDLENEGMWNARYTIAYPQGVRVHGHDSAGLLSNQNWGTRDGFTVELPRGASTQVEVSGRSDFHPVVFGMGLLELVALLWGLRTGTRRLRRLSWPRRNPPAA